MKLNWVRTFCLACVLCISSLVTPVFAAGEQAAIAQSTVTYTITVNHDLSLEQLIVAGHYDFMNPFITPKYFPLQGKGKEQLVVAVVTIDRSMSSEGVIAYLVEQGLRPATVAELLTFGAAFPDEQRKHEIVALGSVAEVDGRRNVPCLYEVGAWRLLYLDWWDGGWSGYYRFLAVRNK